MPLSEFLKKQGLTLTAFGNRIGACPETVRRYCLRAEDPASRIPNRASMAAIWRETRGQVGPADFYELPAIDVSTQAAGDSAAPPCSNSRPDGAHPAARPILSNGELAEGGAA